MNNSIINDNIYKKLKKTISIDKLKICFDITDRTYQRFQDMFIDRDFDYTDISSITVDDFDIIFKLRKNSESGFILIDISIMSFDNDIIDLGTLTISESNKYKNMAFFEFANYSLYHVFGIDENNIPYNGLHFLPIMANQLELKFKSVTSIELAIDSSISVIKKVRDYKHNHQDYDMVLNGKRVKDPNTVLPLYGEYYESTRNGITRKPTLYLHQKDNSFSLKVYDKAREIAVSDKQYISTNKKLFRTELTVRNEDIKEFCKSLSGVAGLEYYSDYSNILDYLNDDVFLFLLFFKYTKRIIYFIDKRTKVRIYLSDILKVSSKFQNYIALLK